MKTASGFEFDIPKEALDDWELLEDLVDLETNGTKMISVCRRLLGAEGAARLKDHCRDENGKVAVTRIEGEIAEIFELLKDDGKAKN